MKQEKEVKPTKPTKPKKAIKANPFSDKSRQVIINQLTYMDFDLLSAVVNFSITHINELEEPIEEFGMTRKLSYEINNDTKVDKGGNHLTVSIDPVDDPKPLKEDQGEFDYWVANIKKIGLEPSLLELIEKLDDVNYFD